MATYGLYDCEMWHRGKTMPNLELMKVYNYHHSRGEIVRLLRPQDNTSTYTKVIYFKETDAELPKNLEVYGDNKDFYGYGFYKTFVPLDEIYTDTPPSPSVKTGVSEHSAALSKSLPLLEPQKESAGFLSSSKNESVI